MQSNTNLVLASSLAFTLCLSSWVCAQAMSGTYTINPSGSGNRNFKTFSAATAALGTNGVNGPTVFNVASGTYTESWKIPPISGTSATNTVAFRALRPTPTVFLVKLQGSSTHIIDIQPGASHIILEGFDFVKASGLAIQAFLSTSSLPAITNIEITKCRFNKAIAGDSRSRGHIYVEGRNKCNSWLIHENEFDMTAYRYGWYMSQVRLHQVFRNHFKLNGTLYGMYWINNNNSRNVICNNLFTGTTSTSTGSCAVNVAASNINNDVCFNTFSCNCAGDLIRTFGTSSNFNRIYGNILQNTGSGGGINVTILSLNNVRSDGNLFHIKSGVIGRVAGTSYSSLSAWQGANLPQGPNDKNSVTGDPKFVSSTDYHLQPSSPAFNSAVTFSGRYVPPDDYDLFMRGTKQDMGAFEIAAWISYGSGCPGTGNKTPAMSIGGNIAPGEQASLDLGNGRANANLALTIGVKRDSVHLGGSCFLLNQPLILLFLTTDSTGAARFPVSLPTTTVLLGSHVLTQFGVADPGAARGIATTQGVDIRI